MTIDDPRERRSARARLRWFIVAVPVFAVWGAVAGAMGEVVGEAWGGPFLHQLGHAMGTVLLVWALVLAAWLLLRRHADWMAQWAAAGATGALMGLLLYLPILWLAPASMEGLTIALTFYLPLTGAAIAQARAKHDALRQPVRWAAAWSLAILVGFAIAWFAGGGLAGVIATSWPFPVLEKAVAYWWRILPQSILGGVGFGALTALAVPLTTDGRHPSLPRNQRHHHAAA